GGAGEQGFRRDSKAGGDNPPEVLALCRNGAKGCSGPEINDNEIPAIFMIRRGGIHQPIAADFLWIGITEGEPCVRIRSYDQGVLMEILTDHVLEGPGQRRYDAGDYGAREALRWTPCCNEKPGKEDAVLVRSFFPVRSQPPMGCEGAVIIDPPDNVGVADINDEEHGTYCTFRLGGLASGLRINYGGLSGLSGFSGLSGWVSSTK